MNASAYQRFRLWGGICSIGLNLGLIWLAYLIALGFVSNGSGVVLPLYALGIVVALIVAFLPFEILIGHAGEAAFGRTHQPLRDWLRDWWAVQWFPVLGGTLGIGFFGGISTQPAAIQWSAFVGVIALALILIILLPVWVRRASGLSVSEDPALTVAFHRELERMGGPPLNLTILDDGGDEGVNGAILPFHRDHLFINRAAAERLSPADLAALGFRERWFHESGKSRICSGIVIGWMAAGVALALHAPGLLVPAQTPLHHGLAGAALLTTWCFIALFVWPPVNHRFMLEADAILAQTIGQEATMELLRKIQDINQTDTRLRAGKEQVFHPIPTLERRLQHLKEQKEEKDEKP